MSKKKPLPDSPLVPWIEEFIEDFGTDHADLTVKNYRYDLLKLARFDPALDVLDLDGSEDGVRNITAFIKTVPTGSKGRVISACREFTHWLTYHNQIGRDPGPFLRRPRRQQPRPDPVPDSDVEAILATARLDPWDWLRTLLYLQLGLRKMEAAGIRLRDFHHGTLTFTRFKPRRQDSLPITEDIRLAIEALLVAGAERSDYVFHVTRVSNLPGQKGRVTRFPKTPMKPNVVHRWWTKLLLRADVPHFRLHRTRHTAGSRFYEATKDAALTQRAMGHSDIRTTFSTYVQPDDAKLVTGYEKAASEGLGR